MDQFGGCTEDKSPLLGGWRSPSTGTEYRDEVFSYWIIYIDNIANFHFLKEFKERLEERYRQEEILIYSTTINSDSKLI